MSSACCFGMVPLYNPRSDNLPSSDVVVSYFLWILESINVCMFSNYKVLMRLECGASDPSSFQMRTVEPLKTMSWACCRLSWRTLWSCFGKPSAWDDPVTGSLFMMLRFFDSLRGTGSVGILLSPKFAERGSLVSRTSEKYELLGMISHWHEIWFGLTC